MREKVAISLLVLFVVTLSVSNMLLANKYVSTKEQIPALIGKISAYDSGNYLRSPKIERTSPDFANAGSRVNIFGSGFLSSDNIVVVNGVETKAIFVDESTLSLQIPETLTNQDSFHIFIKNKNGVSNEVVLSVTPTK